jgi:FeS assembly SUF system protein
MAEETTLDLAALNETIIEAIKTVFDPEIPVDIYELGLIYGIDIDPEGAVNVEMTLTSPACPAAGSLPPEVELKVAGVDGVTTSKVVVVWDPPWTPELMSEAAKLELNMW